MEVITVHRLNDCLIYCILLYSHGCHISSLTKYVPNQINNKKMNFKNVRQSAIA